MLREKSVTDLRSIAQGYGISDLFSKDKNALIQAIELKQQDMQPEAKVVIPRPEYDARLMTKPPSKKIRKEEDAYNLLKPYIDRGLVFTVDEERWYMRFKDKTDEGTKRMPLRVLLGCAEKLLA